MAKNSRAKRDARDFAQATGTKYTAARRATRRQDGANDKSTRRAPEVSPAGRLVQDWTAHRLATAVADLGVDIAHLREAEIESASVIESSVDHFLLEEFEGETRLYQVTFRVSVDFGGVVTRTAAELIATRGEGRIVGDGGEDDIAVLLRPRVAVVELVARQDGEHWEVSDLQGITWEEGDDLESLMLDTSVRSAP